MQALTPGRNATIVILLLLWIATALAVDRQATLWQQHGLGAVTVVFLACLLRGETPEVRRQVLVASVFATMGEFVAAPLLGFYTYRLDNVPAFVPPGHGLVYLAAIAAARADLARRWSRIVCAVALATGGTWALWGAWIAPNPDLFGLLLFAIFAAFVLRGRSPLVYACAFFITAFLELYGTAIGAWTWSAIEPTGTLGMGNPPSGIAAAYCVVDWVALRITRRIAAAAPALRTLAEPPKVARRARR
jgi:hypothetical protein